MKDMPENQARALLASPSFAQDVGDWCCNKNRPWHNYIECGLVTKDGTRAGLIMRLEYAYSTATNSKTMQFGVLKSAPYGLQRVYQLTIKQTRKPIKDAHALPHEHWGDTRIPANKDCLSFTFAQAMAHFCQQTNITITPPVEDPTQYRLKP